MRCRAQPVPLGAALTAALTFACSAPEEPPGRRADDEVATTLPVPTGTSAGPAETASADPLEPSNAHKIASIAMRTWVYDRPGDGIKLGYLRAGAVVDRSAEAAGNDDCDGGWYRVRPRGFVCVGKGATLDLEHPVVQAAVRGPDRGKPDPYFHVMSRSPGPHLYFKLPSEKEQKRAEGTMLDVDAAAALRLFGDIEASTIPAFLAEGKELPKPYGAEKRLQYLVHAGRASDSSAFGLITAFDWTNRRFGLTTELDIIPLDRTRAARVSELIGVEIKNGGQPAFVVASGTPIYRRQGEGDQVIRDGVARGRSAYELTGNTLRGERGLLETTEGFYLAYEGVKMPSLREDPAGFAEKGKKWISVSIKDQMLIAYEGKTPVYAAMVSTGRGGMTDPAETHATVRGTFMIHAKHISGLMDGDEGSDDSFELHDVPYIQYFQDGYALHGAYWHDEFGKPRSHGCVNLPPADAAWLFEWTEPVVPPSWHGAVNLQAGTLVYIHR